MKNRNNIDTITWEINIKNIYKQKLMMKINK